MSTINKTVLRILVCCLFLSFLTVPVFANYTDHHEVNVDAKTSSTPAPDVLVVNIENDEVVETKEILFEEDFKEITEEELITMIKDDEVLTVSKYMNTVFITTIDGKEFQTEITNDIRNFLALKQIEIKNISIIQEIEAQESISNSKMWYTGLFSVIFWIAISICIYKLFQKRNATKNITVTTPAKDNFGNTKQVTNKDIPTVTFDDVEGIEELKKDVKRLVSCLKNTEKYSKMGARIPKGVILYGPPGTGKTLIAKAIAGEAGVPFLSAVGSDFVEIYVGQGAKRVRELYKKAKSMAPCIVFIDEVDAVAGKRGNENNSEGDQTLNALLAELDGFNSKSGIITICATNRLDMLDSAFKRAGRFDLKLAVSLPDKKSREKILKIHGKNKIFDDSVNFKEIANKTAGFSGAELEALLNEAALLAVDREKEFITYDEIDDAFFKIIMQGNKKPRSEINKIQYLTAYHEAGHALATKLLTNDSVPSVTIVQSSSGAGGVTFRTPADEGLQSKEYLENLIKVMYAGRAAERIYLGDENSITTGASNDIEQATSIIKQYIGVFGMGNRGMIDIRQFSPDFKDILEEATNLAKELYSDVLSLLQKNNEVLKRIALELLEKETLIEKDIDEILREMCV